MAKILLEPLPPAPMVYTQAHQERMVRILQLALQRVNYSPVSDTVRAEARAWLKM